jgi:hypothetical protein
MSNVHDKINRMTGSPHAGRTAGSMVEHNPADLYAHQPAHPGGTPSASAKISKVLLTDKRE